MGSLRSFLAVLLTLALVAAACSDDDDQITEPGPTTAAAEATTTSSAPATTATPTMSAAPATTLPAEFEPTFEADRSLCGDVIPVLGDDIECGYVVVPADHDDPFAAEYRLATIRIPALDGGGAPVVYLSGGPGGHAIDPLVLDFGEPFERINERHDLIIFDQRGIGRSEPSLACPDFNADIDEVGADRAATRSDEEAVLVDALGACAADLSGAGIDLSLFGTDRSADDVDMIRRALGIDEWHLFGISYGTRLGLEVMRRHPEPVLSAVLDSAFPPQVNGQLDIIDAFDESMAGVSALCEAQEACSVGPDLDDRLAALVDTLDADPPLATAANPLTGQEVDVIVDGDALISTVGSALYDPALFTDLPELFTSLESGEVDVANVFWTIALVNRDFVTPMVNAVVMCRDDGSRTDAAERAAERPDDPVWSRAYDSLSSGVLGGEVCDLLDVGGPGEGAGEPVTSDIPTLVLAGGVDPVTPPSYADLAAETLSAASVVTLPTLGHAVSTRLCAASIVDRFLLDGSVDDDCVADVDPVEFLSDGSIGDLELVAATFFMPDSNLSVDTVVPDDWEFGFSGIDIARGRSVLDLASMSVLAGPAQLEQIFIGFLEDGGTLEFGEAEELDVEGRVWSRRSAADADQVADVYRVAESPTETIVIVILSRPDERDELFTELVEPALAAATLVTG